MVADFHLEQTEKGVRTDFGRWNSRWVDPEFELAPANLHRIRSRSCNLHAGGKIAHRYADDLVLHIVCNMVEASNNHADPDEESGGGSSPDLLDLGWVRERLLDAAQADGCESSVNLSRAMDVLFADVMSRLLTMDECAAQLQQVRAMAGQQRRESDRCRECVATLEQCIAEYAARELYMKGQVDRRNRTLSEQRSEFYNQLLTLKALITNHDADRRLHTEQLHATALTDYKADHRPILQRKGSKITFDGDGRNEAAEWNQLLQNARTKLDKRSRTFELQIGLMKEELAATKLQCANLAELVDRYQIQQRELRDQLRALKGDKASGDAKAAEQIHESQTRVRLLEERLENSVSSVSVSKFLQQGDVNSRAQISAMTRAREELSRQHADEVKGLKGAFALERKQWKQKEEQLATSFSTRALNIEQANRRTQLLSQNHRGRRLSKDNPILLRTAVPDATNIAFDSGSESSVADVVVATGHAPESATPHPHGRRAHESGQTDPNDRSAEVSHVVAADVVADHGRRQRPSPATQHQRASFHESDAVHRRNFDNDHRARNRPRVLPSNTDLAEIGAGNASPERTAPDDNHGLRSDRIKFEQAPAMIIDADDGLDDVAYRRLQVAPNQIADSDDRMGTRGFQCDGDRQDERVDESLNDFIRNDDVIQPQRLSAPNSLKNVSIESIQQSSVSPGMSASRHSTALVSRIPSQGDMTPSAADQGDMDSGLTTDDARRRIEAIWDVVLVNSRGTQCDIDDLLLSTPDSNHDRSSATQKRAVLNWKSMHAFVLLQVQSRRRDPARARKQPRRTDLSVSPRRSPSSMVSRLSQRSPTSMRIIFDHDPDRPIYRVVTPR